MSKVFIVRGYFYEEDKKIDNASNKNNFCDIGYFTSKNKADEFIRQYQLEIDILNEINCFMKCNPAPKKPAMPKVYSSKSKASYLKKLEMHSKNLKDYYNSLEKNFVEEDGESYLDLIGKYKSKTIYYCFDIIESKLDVEGISC